VLEESEGWCLHLVGAEVKRKSVLIYYLYLKCIFVCMCSGYFLCMEDCSSLGWFNMLFLIACVESMFLYFK
jgi:hypothetical protein